MPRISLLAHTPGTRGSNYYGTSSIIAQARYWAFNNYVDCFYSFALQVAHGRARVLYAFLYMPCASIEVSAERMALTVPVMHSY